MKEQYYQVEEAILNLTTPVTSKAETSETEIYSRARPKTSLRAKTTAYAYKILSHKRLWLHNTRAI